MLRRTRSPSNERLPISRASAVFEELVRKGGDSIHALSSDLAFGYYTGFASVRFDTPGTPDSDGLLYQFGLFKFSGDERFHLDLVRQFEVLDGDEHDHYMQFHCELIFDPTPEMRTLGRFHDWYFYSGDSPGPAGWLASIRGRQEWTVLPRAQPLEVRVSQEDV